MPRKKTVQLTPLEVHDYGDVVVELYPDDHLPKGRGLHRKYARYVTFHNALETLLEARDERLRGRRQQRYFDMITSATVLGKEVRQRYGPVQSLQVTIRICRHALRTFAMATKEDQVRLPYQLALQEK
jgi:hypothetical protein